MKKLIDKNIRSLTRMGKASYGVTLPVETVKALGWKEKQKLVVKKVRGGVLIKDWKK
jgi:bifunctional DNA-binding transcriptional regulator/antitoxin component of YhaV-PrlF toxin-antitoxin module